MKHRVKRIHFVGIGGAGMSGLAEVLHNLGYCISGSDVSDSAGVERLRRLDMKVFIGHTATQIGSADVVIVSAAICPENVEVKAALAKGIPVVPRAMMLAELMRLRRGIAIAGTHGKTTTTSLVTAILAAANMDPTFVIGGQLNSCGSNARLGTGDFIVVEADESDASFLYLSPVLAVVTNIDYDHMDTYEQSFSKLKQSFCTFLNHLPFYGSAVLCVDDPNIRQLMPEVSKRLITYGFSEQAHITARDIRPWDSGVVFSVLRRCVAGEAPFEVHLCLPGEHNVLNTLAAVAVATELGISQEAICAGVRSFSGVGRRFQRYETVKLPGNRSISVIDDYGHHPVEISVTLKAARSVYPERRLVLVFQPHRYTRTRDLFAAFVDVLSQVDTLVLLPVYSAGEAPIQAASSDVLLEVLQSRGEQMEALLVKEGMQNLLQTMLNVIEDNDVVIVMGAGSIGRFAQELSGLEHAGEQRECAAAGC